MNTHTLMETRDIFKIFEDDNHYPSLPEHRKTVAVSLTAVTFNAHHLEYVPESVISKEFEGREICRAALEAKNAECTILPYIPFTDVQKEGIERFLGETSAFVLYSFADIRDAQMAQDAVKADAYCIQLVPDELLTKDLCRTTLQNPDIDGRMKQYVFERFPELKTEQMQNDEKQSQKEMKIKF